MTQNFIGMVAGDLLGGGGEDDEDDYDSSEMAASDSGVGSPSVGDEEEKEPAAPSSTKSTSSSKSKDNEKSTTTKSKGKRKAAEEQEEGDDESEAASESKPKRAPAKKKKKVSPKAAKIKSAEYISDSDEEASGSATPSVGGDGAPVKKSKASSSGSKGNDKKPAKKKGSPKQPKALKEGEQRKGTAEEEARVKKLKVRFSRPLFLVAADPPPHRISLISPVPLGPSTRIPAPKRPSPSPLDSLISRRCSTTWDSPAGRESVPRCPPRPRRKSAGKRRSWPMR